MCERKCVCVGIERDLEENGINNDSLCDLARKRERGKEGPYIFLIKSPIYRS